MFILAISEIGTSQDLSIIKGEETVSVANLADILCHMETLWLLRRFNLITNIIKDFIMDEGHIRFLGIIHVVISIRVEERIRYIINSLFGPI